MRIMGYVQTQYCFLCYVLYINGTTGYEMQKGHYHQRIMGNGLLIRE